MTATLKTRKKLIEVALPLGRVLSPEERKQMTPEAIRLVGGISCITFMSCCIIHVARTSKWI